MDGVNIGSCSPGYLISEAKVSNQYINLITRFDYLVATVNNSALGLTTHLCFLQLVIIWEILTLALSRSVLGRKLFLQKIIHNSLCLGSFIAFDSSGCWFYWKLLPVLQNWLHHILEISQHIIWNLKSCKIIVSYGSWLMCLFWGWQRCLEHFFVLVRCTVNFCTCQFVF